MDSTKMKDGVTRTPEITLGFNNSDRAHSNVTKETSNSAAAEKLSLKIKDAIWNSKKNERDLNREKGRLRKQIREINHTCYDFNKQRFKQEQKNFQELQKKISEISKFSQESYILDHQRVMQNIEAKKKNIKNFKEMQRKSQLAQTAAELQYSTILEEMKQIVSEAEHLATSFETQLRELARQHHVLGQKLVATSTQIKTEYDKKQQLLQDEERQRKIAAMEKITQWKDDHEFDTCLKKIMKRDEAGYFEKERTLVRQAENANRDLGMKKREAERKLKDVNVQMGQLFNDQVVLSAEKTCVTDNTTIQSLDCNVQEHVDRAIAILNEREIKRTRWGPRVQHVEQENLRRIDRMEQKTLYDEVLRSGEKERHLYRELKSLESAVIKQEQITNSAEKTLQRVSVQNQKDFYKDVVAKDLQEKKLKIAAIREAGKHRGLISQKHNAVAAYRIHQDTLKENLRIYKTLAGKNFRVGKIAGTVSKSLESSY